MIDANPQLIIKLEKFKKMFIGSFPICPPFKFRMSEIKNCKAMSPLPRMLSVSQDGELDF